MGKLQSALAYHGYAPR
ncbi:hypothetical protein [Photorhabdus thracensis]